MHTRSCPRVRRARVLILFATLALLTPLAAHAEQWTLERSLARALEVSPALLGAQATVTARRGEFDEAGRWPNPYLEISVGDGLGQETGDGRWRGQEYAVSQPIPIGGRLRERRRAAGRELTAAKADTQAATLEVEYEAATAFHQLQWAGERVALAQAQLIQAREFRRIAERRASTGDISGREALRLEVLTAEAEAVLEEAALEEAAASLRLRKLLALPPTQAFAVDALSAPQEPPQLQRLKAQLTDHPALRAAQDSAQAAAARVGEARAARIPDLELRLAREEDVFDGARAPAYSVGLQVELPLWNSGRARVSARRGEAILAEAEYQLRLREYEGALVDSHTQLTRLIARLGRHEHQVLEPARRLLAMTERGYREGELVLAELIDATQAEWRFAQERRELLLQARLQEAQLRFAMGLLLTQPREVTE